MLDEINPFEIDECNSKKMGLQYQRHERRLLQFRWINSIDHAFKIRIANI